MTPLGRSAPRRAIVALHVIDSGHGGITHGALPYPLPSIPTIWVCYD
jgi:hypothetical protein